jgi:hypothetical protein
MRACFEENAEDIAAAEVLEDSAEIKAGAAALYFD